MPGDLWQLGPHLVLCADARDHNSLFRELLTYMMEDPRNISVCIHLLFCAKNIERMGDHAANIAETIYYWRAGLCRTSAPRGTIPPRRACPSGCER